MFPEVVKTRLGHYHVPGQSGDSGYEHAALVVSRNKPAKEGDPETVNIACWTYDVQQYPRKDVPITGQPGTEQMSTFHIVANCPFPTSEEKDS